MEKLIQDIYSNKIIAILRGFSSETICPCIQALHNGGIRLAEITFDQTKPDSWKSTCDSIFQLRNMFGKQMWIGAGTVCTLEQAQMAYEAGAQYLISPHTDPKLIAETKRLGLVAIPGALTPSEIAAAHQAGADFVKVFPAGDLPPSYLSAIRGPMPHIPLLAVGNLSLDTLPAYLKTGVAGIGLGGMLANPALAEAGQFDKITALAEAFASVVHGTSC